MLIPAQVKNVAKAAASESTRYAINGIFVERTDGKCSATTTDGRVLLNVRWDDEAARKEFPNTGDGLSVSPNGGDFKAIMGVEHWTKAFKDAPRLQSARDWLKYVVVDEHSANGTITLATHNGDADPACGVHRFAEPSIERNFPAYRDIIPQYTDDNSTTIGMNPKLLANLLTAIAACATSVESKGVRLIVPHDPGKPMRIEADGLEGVQATGVIMPVNLNTKG